SDLGAGDLVVHVARQVPGHRLEPGEAVDGAPRFDLVVAVGGRQHRVLQADLGAGLPVEVGVDAVGVGVQVAAGVVGEQVVLGLGDAAPAHGAQVGVGGDLVGAEQFGEPPGGDVAVEVHRPEAVLGVHVALGGEQV